MRTPRAGKDYPGSLGEFQAWFSADADCQDYLEWLRWPDGFVCSECGESGWRLSDGRFMCSGCGSRTSVTAGTIFDRTRTPLSVWFTACWYFATAKDGLSALALQRAVEMASYQTAWAMLHRFRSVLVRPDRSKLQGTVEIDETYVGGEEAGLSGGRARGKKSLTAIAVETKEPKGFGRCRMGIIEDGSGASLEAFVTENVALGTRVITDGWMGYARLSKIGYVHEKRSQRATRASGEGATQLLRGPHRIAALAKRWLLSTHQGAIDGAHLPHYLNEFVFRFNRRSSRSRGMLFFRVLELAVNHAPVRYQDLIVRQCKKRNPPTSPGNYGAPPSLERPPVTRPWRRQGYNSG